MRSACRIDSERVANSGGRIGSPLDVDQRI